MRKVFLLLLLTAAVCSAQYSASQEVDNWNHNWGVATMDTLHVKAGTDTLLLTGVRPGYNCIVQPLSGDVYLRLHSLWAHWWKVIEGSPFSFSGGKRDTLFLKTAEVDSSVVQVMWTSYK
jgi:hypothetical protein